MFATIRQHIRQFTARRSGTRFQARFRNRLPERNRWNMFFKIALAIALIPIGIVLLFLPGPGMVFLIFAALLIAGESLLAARALDRADLAITRLWARLRR